MMKRLAMAVIAVMAIAGCKRSSEQKAHSSSPAPTVNDSGSTANVTAPAPAAPVPTPGAATADPKSPAAARAVASAYAAEASKGDEAAAATYWNDAGQEAQFAAQLEDYPKVRMRAGEPGPSEGAAGSIYVPVPLVLDLTLRNGSPYQMRCTANLRRVNDVPGASEEQRRWHIQSIDC